MASSLPVISLLSDFGHRDPYVGIMKGVILGLCPAARIVDLTHGVGPQDVRAAALYLQASWPWFPAGSVHLAVVDPGVGTARRMLLAEAGEQSFVAPDNGLLPGALAGAPEAPIWREILPRRWLAHEPGDTFHGRDYFAPSAAFLAAGGDPGELGPLVEDPAVLGEDPGWSREGGEIRGQVVVIDAFGNLVTDIPAASWTAPERPCRVAVAGRRIERFARTFGEVTEGELVAYVGSFGYLEIGVNQGSAADSLGVRPGEKVRVKVRSPGGAGQES